MLPRERAFGNHAQLLGCIVQAYEHAGEIGGDAETLAIGGDSAGGNLAAGVTLVARDRVALGKNAPIIRFQALISPVRTPCPWYACSMVPIY